MAKNKNKPPLIERHEPYLLLFFISFAVMMLSIAPVMLFTKGYFVYYGDFNSQQIPFYHLAHDAVVNGELGWNWLTDLGTNFIGSYSFYLLGSPFFWLTVPFPSEWVPYMIPWLLACKHGIAAVTAYAYIRRFVRSRHAAMVGGLLYAFSGFHLYNIFFNHFQDVTAFFPLMLIAMEQRINENRRGVFALSVFLMAFLNYYFFTGQVVFCILYFILRCPCEDFRADIRKFAGLALESVIGVMMACVILLPSALAIIENYRVKSFLWGLDMVAYSDRTRLWHIFQSFFMLPDMPARPNLFQTDFGKWSSIGGYLPMFSMAGVIAFLSQKKKHWATRLTAVCIVCACIPVLNSMFYMFNSAYYARWYYMPILIMAMMTAYALDNRKIRWRGGIVTCIIVMIGLGVISLLPRKNDDGELVFFDFAKYSWYFWIVLAICGTMLYMGIQILLRRRKGDNCRRTAVFFTAFCCGCSCITMIYFGIGIGAYPTAYVTTAINGGQEIDLPDPKDEFYRIDISENYDNYPMFWGYPNMRCFHSIVPVSVMDFYDAMDIQRDVASRAEVKHYPLRALFNVKYYFDKYTNGEDYEGPELPGFEPLKRENGFQIYENTCFIPMGVAYDTYIDEEELKKSTSVTRERILLKALALTPEQANKYAAVVQKIDDVGKYSMDEAQYVEYCKARRADACTRFDYDSDGFSAEITLDAPKLVFFSVPYESGWTAAVNGKAADVERVSYGFMAVYCGKGSNRIEFRYRTPGLKEGAAVSLGGVGALLLYLLIGALLSVGKTRTVYRRKYCYDYVSAEPMQENQLYIGYAVGKREYLPQPEPLGEAADWQQPDETTEHDGFPDASETDAALHDTGAYDLSEADAEDAQTAEPDAGDLDDTAYSEPERTNKKPLSIEDILNETKAAEKEENPDE